MKKTFISVLAGLMVIGSASALPSPEDRKALCDKFPEKFVWVKNTKACIPVNPCASDTSEDIRYKYCVGDSLGVMEESQIKMVIDKYFKNHTLRVKEINFLEQLGEERYYAVKTTQGGYYGFSVHYTTDFNELVRTAAVGVTRDNIKRCGKNINPYIDGCELYWDVGKSNMKELCKDIVDFASLLTGEVVGGGYALEDENSRWVLCSIELK